MECGAGLEGAFDYKSCVLQMTHLTMTSCVAYDTFDYDLVCSRRHI